MSEDGPIWGARALPVTRGDDRAVEERDAPAFLRGDRGSPTTRDAEAKLAVAKARLDAAREQREQRSAYEHQRPSYEPQRSAPRRAEPREIDLQRTSGGFHGAARRFGGGAARRSRLPTTRLPARRRPPRRRGLDPPAPAATPRPPDPPTPAASPRPPDPPARVAEATKDESKEKLRQLRQYTRDLLKEKEALEQRLSSAEQVALERRLSAAAERAVVRGDRDSALASTELYGECRRASERASAAEDEARRSARMLEVVKSVGDRRAAVVEISAARASPARGARWRSPRAALARAVPLGRRPPPALRALQPRRRGAALAAPRDPATSGGDDDAAPGRVSVAGAIGARHTRPGRRRPRRRGPAAAPRRASAASGATLDLRHVARGGGGPRGRRPGRRHGAATLAHLRHAGFRSPASLLLERAPWAPARVVGGVFRASADLTDSFSEDHVVCWQWQTRSQRLSCVLRGGANADDEAFSAGPRRPALGVPLGGPGDSDAFSDDGRHHAAARVQSAVVHADVVLGADATQGFVREASAVRHRANESAVVEWRDVYFRRGQRDRRIRYRIAACRARAFADLERRSLESLEDAAWVVAGGASPPGRAVRCAAPARGPRRRPRRHDSCNGPQVPRVLV
ncbi:hypothetical protein JL721_8852 [Aureococcus anophagefferens]|nr:hypothetical protein JL721_8852 [Aureococcus anophagefferens]